MALSSNRERTILAALLSAGGGLRLALAAMPVRILIGKLLSDDSFYYFAIARNIARGAGATFDGLGPTNGFHPLFAALMVPCYLLFPSSPEIPVHCGLALLAAFDVLAGYFIYRTIRLFADGPAALFAAAFWLLNPCIFFVTMTGTEAGLSACCAAIALFLYTRGRRDARSLLVLGAATGLALLARSDSIFLLAAIAAGLLAERERPFSRRVTAACAVCGAALLVCLPWLLWNLASFGTIRQVSGEVKPYLQRLLFLRDGGGYDAARLVPKLLENARMSFVMMATSSGVRTLGFTSLLLLVLSAALLPRARDARPCPRLASVILVYLGAVFCFYSFYFWHIQAWYFHTPLMAFSMLLGWSASRWAARLPRHGNALAAAGLALVLVAAAANGARHWRIGFYPWQTAFYDVARDLGPRFGTGARFGAFNAGIYGYYSAAPVVNMDGLVNNRAFDAMKRGTLFTDFMRESGIRFVADQEMIVRQFWGFFGKGPMESVLSPVASLETPWRFSDGTPARIVVYEVVPPPPSLDSSIARSLNLIPLHFPRKGGRKLGLDQHDVALVLLREHGAFPVKPGDQRRFGLGNRQTDGDHPAGEFLLDRLPQVAAPRAADRRHRRVDGEVARVARQSRLFDEKVCLVEDRDRRFPARTDFRKDSADSPDLFFRLRVRDVDDVEQEVGLRHPLEGRLERFDEVVRELADEPHRVREERLFPLG